MKTLYLKKRGIIQLLILIIALIFFSIAPATRADAIKVGDTMYFEGFESANTLQQNGTATIILTDDYAAAGGKSLSVAPTAENNYSGVALRNNSLDTAIARFIKTGVKVGITELDIPYGSYSNQHTTPLTKKEELLQARLYAQLFKVYKKYAGSIERVTFWGKTDSQSWRAPGSPLLFDRVFAAKQGYYAVIDPEGFLLSN